jgi:hypothetical protein
MLTVDALEWGFNEINECIDDFVCDIPKAAEIVQSCAQTPLRLAVPHTPGQTQPYAKAHASLLCTDCHVDRMRSSCGISQVTTSKASPADTPELERADSRATLERGDSVASVATSVGDYEPVYDDGVAATSAGGYTAALDDGVLDDEDL